MNIAVNNKLVTLEDIATPMQEVPKELQIAELKQKLADTDYVACKIAEGVATREEYIDILTQRELWRIEINKLESKED